MCGRRILIGNTIIRTPEIFREKIDQWMHRLPKNRPLVLYCDYGSTSLLAARKLGREGYEVYTVVGGIEAMRTSD